MDKTKAPSTRWHPDAVRPVAEPIRALAPGLDARPMAAMAAPRPGRVPAPVLGMVDRGVVALTLLAAASVVFGSFAADWPEAGRNGPIVFILPAR